MRAIEEMRQEMRTNCGASEGRPFHGLEIPMLPAPGAYGPGFMLAPAPQAKPDFSGKAA